jgi:hypothetical protein
LADEEDDFRCEFAKGVQPKDFEPPHDSFIRVTVT